MTDFWDRKLLKTQQELKAIQSGLKRAKVIAKKWQDN